MTLLDCLILTLPVTFVMGMGFYTQRFVRGVKAALSEMGLVRNALAAPFAPFSGKELETVRDTVRALREKARP